MKKIDKPSRIPEIGCNISCRFNNNSFLYLCINTKNRLCNGTGAKGMSRLAASDGQPGNWEEPGFFLLRPETVRFQAEGWQEPYESRGSRTVLRGTGGETPPVYPTHQLSGNWFLIYHLKF